LAIEKSMAGLQTYTATWSGDVPKLDDPTDDVYKAFTAAQSVLAGWRPEEVRIAQDITLSNQGKPLASACAIAELFVRLVRVVANRADPI
jgi:hypothetical protein